MNINDIQKELEELEAEKEQAIKNVIRIVRLLDTVYMILIFK